MHNTETPSLAGDAHIAYLGEVAALAMAAAVRLTSHKGKPHFSLLISQVFLKHQLPLQHILRQDYMPFLLNFVITRQMRCTNMDMHTQIVRLF